MVTLTRNDRLDMSCPEGMKPSADYVTCERKAEATDYYTGEWKFPPGVEPHGIFCLKGYDEKPQTPKPTKEPTLEPTLVTATDLLCEVLNDEYYDETVEVSISGSLFIENYGRLSFYPK